MDTGGTVGAMMMHPMTAPTAPKKAGASYPLSQESTSVSPARDRGEANPAPVEHCEAKRKAFETGYLGS